MKIQPINPIHSILKYKKKNKKMKSWYEVRVDGEKIVAVEPISPEALDKAHDIVVSLAATVCSPLTGEPLRGEYDGKMLQIVAVGSEGWEEIVYEKRSKTVGLK